MLTSTGLDPPCHQEMFTSVGCQLRGLETAGLGCPGRRRGRLLTLSEGGQAGERRRCPCMASWAKDPLGRTSRDPCRPPITRIRATRPFLTVTHLGHPEITFTPTGRCRDACWHLLVANCLHALEKVFRWEWVIFPPKALVSKGISFSSLEKAIHQEDSPSQMVSLKPGVR